MAFDPHLFRAEFPVTRSCIYMNHAAVAPISRRVRDAMAGLIDDVCQFGAAHWDRWAEAYCAARNAAARLLNADPREIAFTKNTSEGISTFANGLEWQEGDEVVSVEGEFPANYYPWQLLERKGVKLSLVPQTEGLVSLDAICSAIGARTRVVAVSFVQYLSGYRIDLEKLGDLCHSRGVLLFVDAIQGLGAFPLDVRRARIAALAADAHKWLLGPEGSALFFLRQELFERVRPTTVGWFNFKRWGNFEAHDTSWRDDARRYECGTPNTVGIYGLGAAINLLLEIGVTPIAEHILDLTDHLRHGLKKAGHQVFGPIERQDCSGIVSFVPRQSGTEDIVRLLRCRRIEVAARGGKVRVSPHFYNTHEEIDGLLGSLP
jgi:selenocysteine lyase/cysteine desulfurase